MFTTVVLYGLLAPAGVSAVALGLGFSAWKRTAQPGGRALASGALAVAGGLILAQVLLLGLPRIPPAQANDWFVLLVIGAALFGLVDALWALPAALRWLLRAGFALAVPALILLPLVRHSWPAGQSAAALLALGGGVLITWTALDKLGRELSGASLPLVLALLAGGSGAILALSGSASLGQLAGALAAVFGPAILLALWQPQFRLGRGAMPPLAVGLWGLWLNGAFYADLPLSSLGLLAATPVLILAFGLGPFAELRPWQRTVLRVAALAAFVTVASGLAWSASPPLAPEPYW